MLDDAGTDQTEPDGSKRYAAAASERNCRPTSIYGYILGSDSNTTASTAHSDDKGSVTSGRKSCNHNIE